MFIQIEHDLHIKYSVFTAVAHMSHPSEIFDENDATRIDFMSTLTNPLLKSTPFQIDSISSKRKIHFSARLKMLTIRCEVPFKTDDGLPDVFRCSLLRVCDMLEVD